MTAPDDNLIFAELLERDYVVPAPPRAEDEPPPQAWLETLAQLIREGMAEAGASPRRLIQALIAGIDATVVAMMNVIIHHPDFQAMEATWRGLHMLVSASDRDAGCRVKVLDVSKRDLNRTLRKFRGNAWDQSPIFRRIYEEEYGTFGGEPYGLLVGDYTFDHRPDDVAMLSDIAQIAAAAHSPFIAAAAPSLLQMDSWAEIANPRDLTRIFSTPEYIPWGALRGQENARYLGLCMPRFLARLPYGARTAPLDGYTFEEETEGPDTSRLLWGNAAYAFGTNVLRAFATYGWCIRIRGIDRGGAVMGLPVLRHPTADGDTDRRTVTEICLSERRDAELAGCGLIPLVHRKNSDIAAFLSAQSLQKPETYDDPRATANASMSARLPYLFASCRFAHYMKCMIRDKVGSTRSRGELSAWLSAWLISYVDGSPATSPEGFKAAHPLAEARVIIDERPDMPGHYDVKLFLRPHYQLEGMSVTLRLVSSVSREARGSLQGG